MSDLISRAEAIDALKQLQKNISGDYTELDPMVMAGTAYIGDCIVELQDLPSAELPTKCIAKIQINKEQLTKAVDEAIIRCGDCANWDRTWTNDYAPDYHYCPMIDGARRKDFFCADAERRTDEAD